ncbi:MAG: type IV secretory system conjugative DNA transfer family protein [Oribacterium sp.]|nr:type IV secretory system conjugative DNA transfer family protein [Oribacterium sp.]
MAKRKTGGMFSNKIELLDRQSNINRDRDKRYKDDFKFEVKLWLSLSLLAGIKMGNAIYVLSPDRATLAGVVTLEMLMEYMKEHPFALFPTAWQWPLLSLMAPLIAGVNSYQEYLRKRNVMWENAHGSGGFEKNYPGFYREFVYDPEIIGGRTIAISEGKKVSALIDHVTKKDLRSRVLYLMDTKLFLTKNNMITKKMQEECILNSQLYSNTVMLSMNTMLTQRNLSCTVLGASGTGKSRFIVKPNLLQANSSYVVTDPSGENMASTAAFLESRGYLIKVFNLKDMELSNRYNPFCYIRSEKDIPSLVNCLKNNIDTAGKGEKTNSGAYKFWDDATIALLCACVGYLYEVFTEDEEYLLDESGERIPLVDEDGCLRVLYDIDGNPLLDEKGEPVIAYELNPYWKGKRNFKNVMNMIRMSYVDEGDASRADEMDQLFADWEISHPKSYAVNQYKTFKLASNKTTREILVSTAVLLGNYFDLDECTNLTFRDEMELEKLGKQKMAIYIITPEGDVTFNWLAACLYSQIFTTLYRQGEENAQKRGNGDVALDIPVRLLIDEMSNIGSIPQFNIKLSTMRKYRISAMPIFQSRSQLDECFGKQAETMLENCDTLVFLGGAGEKTTKELSGKLGRETIKTFSYGATHGRNGATSENRQEIGRDLLSPDEIARLSNDECLIWIRGLKPFCSKKYVYERHPNYCFTPEGASKKDMESKRWVYSIKRFKIVYSDDVIQAVSVYSPSDPGYESFRDPRVLQMIAREKGLDMRVLLKDALGDGLEKKGPVYTGRRYINSNKKTFFDVNNLKKQIEDKRALAELKKKAMEQAANVSAGEEEKSLAKEVVSKALESSKGVEGRESRSKDVSTDSFAVEAGFEPNFEYMDEEE